MFGKAKGRSHETDEPLPPAPRRFSPRTSAQSHLSHISCIGPRMTVEENFQSSEAECLGRVEGELHASIVRISTAPKWMAPSPHRN